MNELYTVNGQEYSVGSNNLQSFLTQFPDAVKKDPSAKTSPTSQSALVEPGTALNMGFNLGSTSLESQEDDTFIERALGKNIITDFFGDIYRSAEQGFTAAQAVGENLDLYNQGVDASDETILKAIEANRKAMGAGMSDEMRDFSRIYEEEGKGVWGFIKGVINNPTIIPQVFTSSMATLAGSFFDAPEVAGTAIAAAGTGAAAGAAITPYIAGAGAVPGGFAGFFGGLGGAMEAGLTFGELLQEELKKEGKDFSLNNVKEFLADEEKYDLVKRRAVGRGIAIGAIESLSGGLAGKAAGTLYRGGRPLAAVAAGVGVESVGGGTGEVAGRLAANQEMDVAEIGFEAIAGTATAPVSIAAGILNQPTYKIKGKKVTKADILNQLKGEDVDIAGVDFSIENDPNLQEAVTNRQRNIRTKASIRQANPNLSPTQIDKLAAIQDQIDVLETNKTITGKNKKKDLTNQYNETEAAFIENPESYAKDQMQDITNTQIDNALAEQDRFISETFQNDKNFSKTVVDVLGGLGVPLNILKVSSVEDLKVALTKMGVPEEKLTPKYLQEQFKKGGLFNNGMFFVNENVISEQAKEGANLDFTYSHETVHGLSNLFIKNVPSLITELQKIIGTEQTELVHTRMKERQEAADIKIDGNETKFSQEQIRYAEEFLANYMEVLKSNKANDNILTKIGEFIRKYILKPLGYKKAGFKTASEINEFIKDFAREDVKSVEKTLSEAKQVDRSEKIVADKPLAAALFEEIDGLVPKNIKTKAEYDVFTRSPEGVKIFNSIYTGAISNYIKNRSVSQEESQKVIDGTIERVLKFNPESKRADGSIIGMQGFVERIMSDTRFAKLDAKKALFEQSERTKKEVNVDESEAAERSTVQIADETTSVETTVTQKQGTQIKALSKLTANQPELKQEYEAAVKDFIENENIEELNYKTLGDITPNTTLRIFNSSDNFIKANGEVLHAILPLGAMKQSYGGTGLKTSTGMKQTILNNFYKKESRADMKKGTAAGLPVQTKLPFDQKQWNELFTKRSGDRNQKTLIKALQTEVGRAITNSEVRRQILESIEKGESKYEVGVVNKLADGKSELLAAQTFVKDTNGKVEKTQVAINENIVKYDPRPKEITKVDNILKEMYTRFIAQYPEQKNKKTPLSLKNFRRYVEEYNAEKIVLINNDNLESLNDLKGPSNSEGSDLAFISPNNNILKIEAKSKMADQTGEVSVRFKNNEISQGKNPMDQSKFAVVKKHLVDSGFVIKLKEYLKEAKATVTKDGVIRVTEEGHNRAKAKGLLPNTEIKFDNVSNILQHYDGTDILYHAKEDKFHALNNTVDNIPFLQGKSKYEIRLKRSGGNVNIVIVNRITSISSKGVKASTHKFGLAAKPFNAKAEIAGILEETKGMAMEDVPSFIASKQRGKKKDRFRPLIPYSAEDFEGLMYPLYGKGDVGNKNALWFKDNIYRPLAEGLMAFDAVKQATLQNFKEVKKEIKASGIDLSAESSIPGYTKEQALRVRLWVKKGYTVPGLSKNEAKTLSNSVRQDFDSMQLMEKLDNIFEEKIYPEPGETNDWLAGTMLTDILDHVNDVTRKEYLAPFFNNVDEAIGVLGRGGKLQGDNVNKLRALMGENYIDALENILNRIRTGRNRNIDKTDDITNSFLDWTNNSVGTIMFFNTRSALLQTISSFNFINWSDNNIVKAGAAFADQKQFWADFAFLYNSDFLKARRSGLKTDVNADEIANATANSTNKVKSALAAILKKGFLPTQIADSFAISIGGASFYRNRLNKYLSEGMSKKQAEEQTFLDFQELAETAQQSSRPDKISKQQASPLGRLILAFQNTPMQYTRLMKKAALDLINKRGDWKSNVSKIVYYGAIQNLIFHALQTALFALAFDDEEEDDKKDRLFNIGNRMADTLIVGTGVYGAIAATTKNVILEIIKQEKGRKDFTQAAIKTTSLSPPINSKLQKMIRAGRRFTYKQEREKIRELGLDTKNPAVISAGEVLSAVFNLPADRAIRKWNNLVLASNSETELWQSIALALGYSEWDVKLGPNQKEPKMNARIKIPRQKIKREKIKREKIKRD